MYKNISTGTRVDASIYARSKLLRIAGSKRRLPDFQWNFG